MTCSSPDFAALLPEMAPSFEVIFGSTFSFAGEIGMVSRGTGELDLTLVAAVTGFDMAEGRMQKEGGGGKSKWDWREVRSSEEALRLW